MQTNTTKLSDPHHSFLTRALERLRADERFVGVAVGGSYLSRTMDEYSDLDLIVAVEPALFDRVLAERCSIAAGLGDLLSGFTGEHVGEPRLVICLFGPPLLHVDLKFVSLEDVAQRVEDPEILWQRGQRLSDALATEEACYPQPDLQWIEDRFWVWVHYGSGKIGRGELFEAVDFLAFLRGRVLGPLALLSQGATPNGVRKLETAAPELASRLEATVATYAAIPCAAALRATVDLYRELRTELADETLEIRSAAEAASISYLATIEQRIAASDSEL